MTRTVRCDFCSIALTNQAWDFPARDIDYDAPRAGPDSLEPLEGSIGSWLACNECARLIQLGERGKIARRSAERFKRSHPDWVALVGYARVLGEVRDLHDCFWAAREGEGVRIGAEQLALIARDPAFAREWRPNG